MVEPAGKNIPESTGTEEKRKLIYRLCGIALGAVIWVLALTVPAINQRLMLVGGGITGVAMYAEVGFGGKKKTGALLVGEGMLGLYLTNLGTQYVIAQSLIIAIGIILYVLPDKKKKADGGQKTHNNKKKKKSRKK